MKTVLRAVILTAVLALTGALVGSGNVSSHPQAIHFGKGRTSTLLQGILAKAAAAAPHEYSLRGQEGQVLTIRFTGLDQGASYSVYCPHGGRLDLGQSPVLSSTLPVSGDYTVVIEKKKEGEPVPYALEVGIAGKAGPVAPRGITGFYQFNKSGFPTLEARELPDGQVRFVFYAQWGGREETGPAHVHEVSGTVPLRNGVAVQKVEDCKRTMTFTRTGVRVAEEGTCAAQENLFSFDGAYRKVSPCASPVTLQEESGRS